MPCIIKGVLYTAYIYIYISYILIFHIYVYNVYIITYMYPYYVGTPMQNDLIEFYNMVSFCNPAILGSVSDFRKV